MSGRARLALAVAFAATPGGLSACHRSEDLGRFPPRSMGDAAVLDSGAGGAGTGGAGAGTGGAAMGTGGSAIGTGGAAMGTGGVVMGTGGAIGTGGVASTGGAIGTGGVASTGGATGSGGAGGGRWGMQMQFADPGLYGGGHPQLAADDGGNVVAVWDQTCPGQPVMMTCIWARRFAPSEGWGAPAPISTNQTDAATMPRLAMNGRGEAVVAWMQPEFATVWAARFVPGAGWQPPASIDVDDTGASEPPRAAIAANGEAMVVWSKGLGPRPVYARRFVPATGWEAAAMIAPPPAINLGRGNDVALGPTGDGVAVWSDSSSVVSARRFLRGSGWSDPVVLSVASGVPFFPRVGVDAAGNAVVVWYQYAPDPQGLASVWTSRLRAAGSWDAPALLETSDVEPAINAELAMNPAGEATVVWMQFGRWNNIWARRFAPSTGWNETTLLETDDNGPAGYPIVAMYGSGRATALWGQFDGTRQNLWASRFVPGLGWEPRALVETSDADASVSVAVTMDPFGRATALWSQAAGERLWTNRFE
jgi:hypothetical protein